MPTLAGWLTGEQVPQEIIEQTLKAMETVLGQHGGQPARTVQPGAGLVAFADAAYAMQRNDDPPVLDWVPERRTLIYRRPLSGLHPLYYIENWPAQGNLLFASEIKALLALGAPRRLHLPALAALQHYGFIPAPLTAFKDIYVVPAGSILRWQHTKLVVNTSTDYHLEEPYTDSDVYERLHNALKHAVEGMLPQHEQFVALTGAGIASTLATTVATQTSSVPFTIATFSYKKFRATKRQLTIEQFVEQWQHPLLTINGLDQPEFWAAVLSALEAPCVNIAPLALHQLLHTVATETGARVAFTGLGARLLLNQQKQIAPTPTPANIYAWYQEWLNLTHYHNHTLWSHDVQQRLRDEEAWEQSHHARKLAHKTKHVEQSRYYLDLHLCLPDALMNAAYQLAAQERMVLRSPYLHGDVLELLTRLPLQLEDGTPKRDILTKVMQQYYPTMTLAPSALPLTLPIQSLLQNKDSEIVQQTLSPEAIEQTGIFDRETVESLLQGKEVTRDLLLVFTTQLFCRMFGVEL